jgi:hypothetical protein
MNNLKSHVEGEFLLTVSGPRGKRQYRAPNLITNAGLDRLFVNGGVFGSNGSHFVQIGTGTATPLVSDTSLQNRQAATNTLQSGPSQAYTAGPPDYHTLTCTYRFGIGALNGNYTEIGIGWAATGSLWSRALTVNGSSVPTAVQVLSDEQLDVTYVCRVYPPQTDAIGNITLDSVSYAYTMRPAGVSTTSDFGSSAWGLAGIFRSGLEGVGSLQLNFFSDSLKLRTTGPSAGQQVGSPTALWDAYSNGTYNRTIRATIDLNNGNVPGGAVTALVGFFNGSLGTQMAYQIGFSPNVPKDATKRIRLDFRYTFARRP